MIFTFRQFKDHSPGAVLQACHVRITGCFQSESVDAFHRNQWRLSPEYAAVKLLIEQHVDVNAANDAGQTALHFAALSMDSVVELLVKNGANLEARDRQGRPPLDGLR